MIACTSFVSTARSTPLTISVPSSSATCRSSSWSRATLRDTSTHLGSRARSPPRDAHATRRGPRFAPVPGACEQARHREPEIGPERPPARAVVEATVGTGIPRQRLEQVVGRVDRLRLAGVLALPAVSEQDEITRARRELLSPEELLRAPAHRQLAHRVLHAEERCLRVRLGLVDRRDRLRLVADLLPVAVELRRVDRTGEDHGDRHVPTLLLHLDPRGLEEGPPPRLRSAVRALERDPAVRERGVDREEGPARLAQVRQGRPVAVDLAEEVDVHDAPEPGRL